MSNRVEIPENLHYTIDFLSNEWILNNIITIFFILIFLYIGKRIKQLSKEAIFTYSIGLLLLFRIIFRHLYDIYAFDPIRWNVEWSIPLHLCSLSCIISSILFIIVNNPNIKSRYKQYIFDFLFYWGLAAMYAFLTPQYTAGIEGYLYYDYYISHASFIFVIFYLALYQGYRPSKNSFYKVFMHSQILLFITHIININIGGTANYMYTIFPPIAENPLVIGEPPLHIIFINIFAFVHFYLFYIIFNKISSVSKNVTLVKN